MSDQDKGYRTRKESNLREEDIDFFRFMIGGSAARKDEEEKQRKRRISS